MDMLVVCFGFGISFVDFECKVQMMQYEFYCVIFEGMNVGFWMQNSGWMLWMMQFVWLFLVWQIFLLDYDMQVSFYGVKKVFELVYIQMNLFDGKVVVVNNWFVDVCGLIVMVKVVVFDNYVFVECSVEVIVVYEVVIIVLMFDLLVIIRDGIVLIWLEVWDVKGMLVLSNFYWQVVNDVVFCVFGMFVLVMIQVKGNVRIEGDEMVMSLMIVNISVILVIEIKLMMMNVDGLQILLVYFSDNYVLLLFGDMWMIEICYLIVKVKMLLVVLCGWNVVVLIVVLSQ